VENNVPQTVLDMETIRQPFSIGILLDTSSSNAALDGNRHEATEDFVYSLRPSDEYFLMVFSDGLEGPAVCSATERNQLSFWRSRDRGIDKAVRSRDLRRRLPERGPIPHRALFIISDGVNTAGKGSLREAMRQRSAARCLSTA